jgi:hypothetical protein
MPADLDTALAEIAEGCCFYWPESLAVERVHVGIAEIVAAAFVFAGFVVLAQWTFYPNAGPIVSARKTGLWRARRKTK